MTNITTCMLQLKENHLMHSKYSLLEQLLLLSSKAWMWIIVSDPWKMNKKCHQITAENFMYIILFQKASHIFWKIMCYHIELEISKCLGQGLCILLTVLASFTKERHKGHFNLSLLALSFNTQSLQNSCWQGSKQYLLEVFNSSKHIIHSS